MSLADSGETTAENGSARRRKRLGGLDNSPQSGRTLLPSFETRPLERPDRIAWRDLLACRRFRRDWVKRVERRRAVGHAPGECCASDAPMVTLRWMSAPSRRADLGRQEPESPLSGIGTTVATTELKAQSCRVWGSQFCSGPVAILARLKRFELLPPIRSLMLYAAELRANSVRRRCPSFFPIDPLRARLARAKQGQALRGAAAK